MDVHAPRVASHCQPGTVCDCLRWMIKVREFRLQSATMTERQERLPLFFQEVGASHNEDGVLKRGETVFRDFVGPLGCPSEFIHEDIEALKNKKILFVAGGVGAAPVLPTGKVAA